MIVKFHARGTGRGSGPTQYLLGRDGKREGSTLLRGDPQEIAALIDSSKYAKKYTSGVLSFAEADLPSAEKQKLMDSFERALLPGLEARQYSCLWVEHHDKGRLELNFVIPNLELTSGKRLQPYYAPADLRRIDAWATVKRVELDLADPKDPARKRALVTPRDLPAARQEAAKQITDGLLALAAKGEVVSRSDVLEKLTRAGFVVARETKSSISIADPSGGKNIRLKGVLYERDFRLGQELRGELEAASQRYREDSQQRLREARTELAAGIEIKRAEHERRHPSPREAITGYFETERWQDETHGRFKLEVASGELAYDRPSVGRSALVDGQRDSEERSITRSSELSFEPSPSTGGRANQLQKPPLRQFAKRVEAEPDNAQKRLARGDMGEIVDDDGDRESPLEKFRRLEELARERVRELVRRAEEAGRKLVECCDRFARSLKQDTERKSDLIAASEQLECTSEQFDSAAATLEQRVTLVIEEAQQRQRSRSGPRLG